MSSSSFSSYEAGVPSSSSSNTRPSEALGAVGQRPTDASSYKQQLASPPPSARAATSAAAARVNAVVLATADAVAVGHGDGLPSASGLQLSLVVSALQV
jgi:hypothetical protein